MAALKRMLSRTAVIGSLAAATALVGAAAPAQAQVYGYWGYGTYSYPSYPVEPYYNYEAPDYAPRYRAMGMLSPSEIRESLSDDGYRVIGPMQRSGRTYIVNAQNRRGQRFRLVVDGIEGDIIRSSRLSMTPRNEARENDYREGPLGGPSPGARGAVVPPAPHVVPGIGPESNTRPQERPPRAAARPDSEGPNMRPGESNPPVARPQGRPQATRPDAARPDGVKPEVRPVTPNVAKPELVKPETAKPETKPTEPVAAAPRVVYPGGPVTTAPTAPAPAVTPTVPVAPLDAPPSKPTPVTPDVPVAPLE
ncbi:MULTISPECIES: hypothetical protein [unclassified Beijerinckia]|uniref:hypothetical protein n=1 Tax=unclassified Beijerinckia TaxID=2638183 RepID=UPI00089C7EA1|nr:MULTISPECIES: hypothetical protein [unclassified Beijerinckia]MDH7793992.1 hypothetical protein [Beijerinckia sp. GAS462]SEB50970.1 hypothetical protein SAMN05443249_0257 [Beijerinckia sp. 28-YEA-48]